MDFIKEESMQHVFGQIMRLHYVRCHELLENTGAYHGQPPLLFSLYKQNGQSQKELSDKIGIKPATITVMIKRMEKAGLVERRQDDKDQRVSRIFITDKGIEVCKEVAVVTRQLEEECIVNFSNEELILMRRLLMQVRDNLKAVCKKDTINYCMKCEDE